MLYMYLLWLFAAFCIVGLTVYLCTASDDEAGIKKEFQEKLVQNGYRNMYALVTSLRKTTEKEWQFNEHHMSYEPFPGTTIWFSIDKSLNLHITEGSKQQRLFMLYYYPEAVPKSYGSDCTTGAYYDARNIECMTGVLDHLTSVFRKGNNTEMQEKVEPLQEETVMTHSPSLLKEDFDEPATWIEEAMTQLKQEKDWLSIESFHHVNETFPKDLRALNEAYCLVRDKEKVKSDVEEALHIMKQKLQVLIDEVEMSKQNAVKKQKLIIEKR